MRHVLDHVAKTAVLGHSSSEEHLLLADVCHGALGDLREHREGGLLHGQRDVLQRDPLLAERHRRRNHAGECDVHALDRIWELIVSRPLAGQLLEDGARVESHPEVPSELVEHVPDAYVLRFPEYPVAALGERYDLRVPAGCVQERRISASGERAADLYVRDAVVHSDDRYAPHACERPCGRRGDPEARPQARTHGEGYEVYVLGSEARLVHGAHHDVRGDLRVMVRRLAGMEPALRGAEHVQLVGQHVALGVHDPYAQRMSGSFDPQRNHVDRRREQRPMIKWHRVCDNDESRSLL